MNFKLLTFIFVVIGVQSINSSIINKQSIDELVLTSNLDGEIINNLSFDDNPFARIKYLTFNASAIYTRWNGAFKELNCNDRMNEFDNDFCTRGNGKYQAKLAECTNLKYPKDSQFDCKLLNAKVLNRNVQYGNRYRITCPMNLTPKNAKGTCFMEYSFESSASYNEADDVENKDKI